MANNNAVNVSLFSQTGTGSFVGSTSATLVTPALGTPSALVLTNATGLTVPGGISATGTASATNFLRGDGAWSNSSTGNFTLGSLTFSPTTQGIVGTTTNNNASAGYVGEFITSVNSSGTTVSANTPSDITSISLTEGDWLLYGNAYASGSVNTTSLLCWISATSATAPAIPDYNAITVTAGAGSYGIDAPSVRIPISGTTTVYLSGQTSGSGTLNLYGRVSARRMR